MLKTFKQLFTKKRDTTDVVVDRMRQKVDKKTLQVEKVQEQFNKTVTYYLARGMGVMK